MTRNQRRQAASIRLRLAELDAASARSLRALAIGTGSAADRDRLAALEREAGTLRLQLKSILSGGLDA